VGIAANPGVPDTKAEVAIQDALREESHMNQISKVRFANRFSRWVLTIGAVASLAFGATNANASCGMTGLTGSGIKLPMLGQERSWQGDPDSIVGMWGTFYTMTGGGVFNQTLKQWHSDGTEFESAFLSPEMGNVCIGVWKQIGRRTVKLHHLGWLFTPGTVSTASGMFILDEVDTVAGDGKTYTGTFKFQPYDMNGNAEGDPVTGTILATRVTVD
jgi:hypothetical protein